MNIFILYFQITYVNYYISYNINQFINLLIIFMYTDWVSVATISIRQDIKSFPAVTLVSYTDGLLGNGSGIPYLYLTPLDFTAQDLAVSIVTKQNLYSLYVFS